MAKKREQSPETTGAKAIEDLDKKLEERRKEAVAHESLKFVDQALVDWMLAHPAEVAKERQECLRRLQKKRVNYHGAVLPLTLTPIMLTQKSVELIKKTVEVLDRAMDKVIMAYVADETVRENFPYPDLPKDWILQDPGVKKPSFISRHDAIYDGKTLKFIEFNPDNPGGRAWVDVYNEVFQSMPMYQAILGKYWKPAKQENLKAMLDCTVRAHQEFGGGKKPRVGLTSFRGFDSSEYDIIKDYFMEHGVEAAILDSREIEYKNGGAYTGNMRYDVIQLCLRLTFFKRFPKEHQDFYQAVKDKAVLLMNPWRAIIGASKEVMAFMTNPENGKWFDEEEREVIKKHVPWTRRMDETITISPEGRDISLVEYALKSKEKMVLKITTGAGGYEVYVGKACEDAKWKDAVEGAAGSPWWILQEACEIPEHDVPVLKDGKVVLEKKNINLNPYIYDGKYVGCLSRVSESKVINVSSGGGVMPVFEVKSEP